jgi:outer membrane murein-binding lipoprotein Lpp
MRRGQISIDLLFAVTIISITMMGVMSVALNEKVETQTFGTSAQLRVLAIDVRDTMARVYAAGPGMSVVKRPPIALGTGDWINITAYQNGSLVIRALIGGKQYLVIQKLQVPPGTTSSVLLTPTNETFRIEAVKVGDGVEVLLG